MDAICVPAGSLRPTVMFHWSAILSLSLSWLEDWMIGGGSGFCMLSLIALTDEV